MLGNLVVFEVPREELDTILKGWHDKSDWVSTFSMSVIGRVSSPRLTYKKCKMFISESSGNPQNFCSTIMDVGGHGISSTKDYISAFRAGQTSHDILVS